jgi:hypothetical protein
MWKNLRILLLLLVLLWAAVHTWLERYETTRWRASLWVGLYPVNADGSESTQRYIDGLTPARFADIERFFEREAHRYGRTLDEPVHVELYPPLREPPPLLARDAGVLSTALWSLHLRWYAWRMPGVPGRAPPRVRLFVVYHDPNNMPTVPDSHGLQKGLVGVVHAFAATHMSGDNQIIISHELLHTLGASDKYDPASGAPLFPIGYADPQQHPLFPQQRAEIMAGKRALSPTLWEMPPSLAEVVVGPATALEIRWSQR